MNKEDRYYTLFKVRVIPRSSRNQISGKEGEVYKVKLTAPPVEGEANRALIGLIAKRLKISKKDIEIVAGAKSRVKTVKITGFEISEIERLLENV